MQHFGIGQQPLGALPIGADPGALFDFEVERLGDIFVGVGLFVHHVAEVLGLLGNHLRIAQHNISHFDALGHLELTCVRFVELTHGVVFHTNGLDVIGRRHQRYGYITFLRFGIDDLVELGL